MKHRIAYRTQKNKSMCLNIVYKKKGKHKKDLSNIQIHTTYLFFLSSKESLLSKQKKIYLVY